MSDPRSAYLQEMGIEQWIPRTTAEKEPKELSASAEPLAAPLDAQVAPSPAPDIANDAAVNAADLDWAALEAQVATCERCELAQSRTQPVFGVGNRNAELLIIGEAPGAEEDRCGEPFVGRAGNLLDAMLLAIKLERQQVYIANILKCRPPNNRDPQPQEVSRCIPYLYRQITLIQPKLILLLGRIAAQHMLQTDASLARLRGKLHTHPELQIPMLATYHPAYLLRKPQEKRKAWQDLQLAQRTLITWIE